jgi:cytochrome c oxidase subunit II
LKNLLLRGLLCAPFSLVPWVLPIHAQERTIEIRAHRFQFEPSQITVKRGETVTLSLVSDDVTHSLFIEDLGINITIVKGHATQVQVTPQNVGDFNGRCGRFCGSGHGKMTFVLHVVE